MARIVAIDGLKEAAALLKTELKILEADTADIAWALYKNELIDGIVTDLYLDGPVTGADFLKAVLKEEPLIPCLFLTGLTDRDNVVKLWEICPVIPKPIEKWFPQQAALLLREMKSYAINRDKTPKEPT